VVFVSNVGKFPDITFIEMETKQNIVLYDMF